MIHSPSQLPCFCILVLLGVQPAAAFSGGTVDESTAKTVEISSAIVKLIDNVEIPAESSGVIEQLSFREGSLVTVGQEIARIKNSQLVIELGRAEVNLKIARAASENNIDIRFAEKSLEVSSARVTRSRNSNQRVPGVIPKGRVQEQQLEAHRDKLRVEQAGRDQEKSKMECDLAEADVALAKLKLEKSVIRSPIDGMVVAVERKPGEWVQPGDTVVRIVRMNRLRIEGFVSAGDASRIQVGNSATVKLLQSHLQDVEMAGHVIFVNPEANPVNSKVPIWVEVENSELKLIPGLETSLTIHTDG